MSDQVKKLSPEQVKIAMHLKLLEEISKGLRNSMHQNKMKKITLAELQAVSQKSIFAIKKMSDKVGENFLEPAEIESLNQIETEINYEVLFGKVQKKFRWEYTKNLVDYISQLTERIMKRTGIEKEEFYL